VKFRCEQAPLAEALGLVGRAVTNRPSHPVLAGVLATAADGLLELRASDLDVTVDARIAVTVDEPGTAVLPAKLTADIVRSLRPGRVDVDVTADEARVRADRSQFAVRTLSVADYPKVASVDAEPVSVGGAAFADALRQVTRAASTDENRPILTGVLIAAEDSGIRLVATDSYRLAVRDLPETTVLESGQRVLVPSRALSEVARLISGTDQVSVRLGAREAQFDIGEGGPGSVTLITRLIEGEFPNYRQLIPQSYPNRLVVSREELTESLKRVKLLTRDGAPVRLSLGAAGVDLHAVAHDVGQASESIEATYDGAELTVAFNPDYLLAGIDAVSGDEVALETLDPMKPAVVRPTDDSGFLYLLMPVRV
jgi:DNA polymerase III subunit beta